MFAICIFGDLMLNLFLVVLGNLGGCLFTIVVLFACVLFVCRFIGVWVIGFGLDWFLVLL